MNTDTRKRPLVSVEMLLTVLVIAAILSITVLYSTARGTVSDDGQSFSEAWENEDQMDTIWSDAIKVTNHSGYIGEVVSAGDGARKLTGSAPLRVTFEAAGTIPSVESYRWNFGDGDAATGSAASHIFTNPGTYLITLEAVKDSGEVQKEHCSVTVTGW